MILESGKLFATSRELAALLLHSSKDETRPHLSGIAINQATGIVAATDGHRLLAWRGPKCGERKLLIPARSLATLLSVKPGPATRRKKRAPPIDLELRFGADDVTSTVSGITIGFKLGDADRIAPIEQVIPSRNAGDLCSCVAMNPAYFADLEKVCRALQMPLSGVVVQPGTSDLDPILCTFPGRSEWCAVIMPQRFDGTYSAVPKKKSA